MYMLQPFMKFEMNGNTLCEAKSLATEYVKSNVNMDKSALNYVQNQVLKAIFNIFLKLSYALFILGTILTINSASLDQQKIVLYIQNNRNKYFLIILGILGVCNLTLIKQIKEDNKIQPATRKGYNFILDILRTAFYILSIIFVEPFIFDSNDIVLLFSFWIFLAALVLFVCRKIVKWYYYLGKGKHIFGPWESKDINNECNIAKYIHITCCILQQKGLIPDNGKEIQDRIDNLKRIQAQLEQNLAERQKLMAELSETLPLKKMIS